MRAAWTLLTGLGAIAPVVSMVAIPLLWTEPPSDSYEAARANAEAFDYLVMGLMAFDYAIVGLFIVLAFRARAVPATKRGLWAALIFFGNALVIPFFWYWYIWRASGKTDGSSTSP